MQLWNKRVQVVCVNCKSISLIKFEVGENFNGMLCFK